MRIHALIGFCFLLPLAAQEPSAPKLTSHHEAMKAAAGTWDAAVKMSAGPGKPPIDMKGVEVNTLILNGLWMQTEFTGDPAGMSYQGHGLSGYDSIARKHVGTWVDNSGDWPAHSRGTCTDSCKEMTVTFQGYGQNGKPITVKEVCTQKDADHRSMVMYHKGKDGKFKWVMEIAYTRRK
jgi:hypothetical protein